MIVHKHFADDWIRTADLWCWKRHNRCPCIIEEARDQYYKTLFCHNWTAIKLRQDFEALWEVLSGFSSGHTCACCSGLGHFDLVGVNLQMQTHLVSKIMHQNLAVILWQFNYSKNSFIVFYPRWFNCAFSYKQPVAYRDKIALACIVKRCVDEGIEPLDERIRHGVCMVWARGRGSLKIVKKIEHWACCLKYKVTSGY